MTHVPITFLNNDVNVPQKTINIIYYVDSVWLLWSSYLYIIIFYIFLQYGNIPSSGTTLDIISYDFCFILAPNLGR